MAEFKRVVFSDQSSSESERESSEDSIASELEEEEDEMSEDSALSVPEKAGSKGKRKKGE